MNVLTNNAWNDTIPSFHYSIIPVNGVVTCIAGNPYCQRFVELPIHQVKRFIKMDKKSLMKDIGYKLSKIRKTFKFNPMGMARRLGVERSSYARNEYGQTPPKLMTLYNLASNFNISLNWLLLNEGPMHLKEKETKKEPEPSPGPPDDVKEMVEIMEKVPVLRYKVLLYFNNLKEEHKEMIGSAMKD
jgi:transcriptional regulator with XRE-family HTH domain